MSLAARCPSCGTVFRVVQDQLRVSEGWVRCGRCNGVFNASEVLFDIDSGAPVLVDLGGPGATADLPPAPSLPASAAPVAAATAASAGPPQHEPDEAAAPPAAPSWPGERLEPHFGPAPAWTGTPATSVLRVDEVGDVNDELSALDGPLLRAPSRDDAAAPVADRLDDIVITDHVPEPGRAEVPGDSHGAGSGDDLALASPPDAAGLEGSLSANGAPVSPVQAIPSFLRTRERKPFWHRPAMRAALALGVLVLAATLAVQAALLWRDTLAARWPESAPALQAMCRLAGCRVEPLRRIEALSVHSSGLSRLEGSDHYRLRVVLHNRADTALMMPALELTLSDGPGRLVARRVLQVAELGVPQPVLQPGEELPINALLATAGQRVDGYTLELFYP